MRLIGVKATVIRRYSEVTDNEIKFFREQPFQTTATASSYYCRYRRMKALYYLN